jgi:hypothetical protein
VVAERGSRSWEYSDRRRERSVAEGGRDGNVEDAKRISSAAASSRAEQPPWACVGSIW